MLSGWTLIDLNNVGSGKREVEIVVIDKKKKKKMNFLRFFNTLFRTTFESRSFGMVFGYNDLGSMLHRDCQHSTWHR